MPITKDILRRLAAAECRGPFVRLPDTTFNADDDRVHQALIRAGATWSRRHKAYLFADLFPFGQAAPLIEQMCTLKRLVRPDARGMTSCPQATAERMCDEIASYLMHGAEVLEPSAGHGILAAEAAARGAQVDCYELDAHRAQDIEKAGIARTVTTADFLRVEPRAVYDAVLMYPPHRRDLAARHVVHAHKFLRPGGTMAALVSPGLEQARGPAGEALRDLWTRSGWHRAQLEPGDIQSPTGVAVRADIWFFMNDEETDGHLPPAAPMPSCQIADELFGLWTGEAARTSPDVPYELSDPEIVDFLEAGGPFFDERNRALAAALRLLDPGRFVQPE